MYLFIKAISPVQRGFGKWARISPMLYSSSATIRDASVPSLKFEIFWRYMRSTFVLYLLGILMVTYQTCQLM